MNRPRDQRGQAFARLCVAWCAALLCAALMRPGAAMAQSDRDETTPTGWWVIYQEATVEQVEERIDLGFRLVDIEVVQASPLRLHAVFVRNEGPYQKAWWWYYGQAPEQLQQRLDENNGRLIDLEPYVVDGRLVFAAIMIENTGADQAGWWWLYGQTFEELQAFVASTPGLPLRRIIDLERYTFGGVPRYAAVIIQNEGVHFKPWWWYVNVGPDTIAEKLSEHSARLVDLEPFGSSGESFMAVMTPREGKAWWWWWGAANGDQIAAIAAQTGSRIIDLERYPTPFGNRYAAVFLNNSNPLTTRVGGILRSGTDGVSGLYLKAVNGPVLAWLQGDYIFEPASAIKVLHHAHALLRVQFDPAVTLNTQVEVFLGTDGSCPLLPGEDPISEQLSTVLQRMMVNSDNLRTQAVRTFFGEANINATAQALGMNSTELQHRIGCCRVGPDFGITSPNRLTLEDAGRLYELAATGLFTPVVEQSFYDLMITSAGTPISDVITEEGNAVGLTAAQLSEFRSLFRYARKDGSYGCAADGICCLRHRTRCGWVSIPFRSRDGCDLTARQFVLGIFVNDASDPDMAATAVVTAYAELLRELIRDAAMTWLTPCVPCPSPDCPADWNCDGQVNSTDLSAFVTSWLASIQNGTLEADFNNDLVVDSSDLSAFITAWLAGVNSGC